MNVANAQKLRTVSLPSATWYRAVAPAFAASQPQASSGVTRFNQGPAASRTLGLLYFAPDPVTALFEVEALLGSIFTFSVPNPFYAAVVSRHVVPRLNIVDLGDPATRRIVETSRQELTGDWRTYRPPGSAAPTQTLAHAIYRRNSSVHGIRAPSARNPNVTNLILFYQRVVGTTPSKSETAETIE